MCSSRTGLTWSSTRPPGSASLACSSQRRAAGKWGTLPRTCWLMPPRAGSLRGSPSRSTRISRVGPTLGLSSLKSGLLASLVGFGLVLLLLLVIYRALGVVADVALLIYAFLLWGLIVIIPITVTLPGIAGIVLSIGVAADANVVIFERIKEEIRRGKTPRSAIQAGYDKGYRAILDGNVTTLITAFILFALSSGSVRGFAVLLAIGVVLSMFTAIVITRALLGLLSDRGIHLSPALMGVSKASISAAQQARVR